jgi:hypothetical protein
MGYLDIANFVRGRDIQQDNKLQTEQSALDNKALRMQLRFQQQGIQQEVLGYDDFKSMHPLPEQPSRIMNALKRTGLGVAIGAGAGALIGGIGGGMEGAFASAVPFGLMGGGIGLTWGVVEDTSNDGLQKHLADYRGYLAAMERTPAPQQLAQPAPVAMQPAAPMTPMGARPQGPVRNA